MYTNRCSRAAFSGLFIVVVMSCLCTFALADEASRFDRLTRAGFLISDNSGQEISGKKQQQAFIPASATKLVTALLALQYWGEDHRFGTEIYFDRTASTLWLKAAGDPFLVSEEVELMADAIINLNTGSIDNIAFDVSLFDSDLIVPGATVTNNPYDAIPSAIAANFNTVYLKKEAGKIVSAEPQTPLTPFALTFAHEISGESLRINTGRKSGSAEQYFAELLTGFLENKGVTVAGRYFRGVFPVARADIVHYNSRTLGEMLQAMLKYSTNFIANQIMLTLVAEQSGEPANFENVNRFFHRELRQQFDWRDFSLYEGAGLSAKNRLTPAQLVELLVAFRRWRHLLPEVEPGIFAKTGTLTDVSTLAGYFGEGPAAKIFAIMINETVPTGYIREVALEFSAEK